MTAAAAASVAPALAGYAAATPPPEPPPVEIGRDPAREAARDELSRQIYHQDDPSVFTRLFDWLADRFGELLDRATSVAPGGAYGLTLLLVLVIGLLIVLRLKLGPLRVAAPSRRDGLFAAESPRTAAEYRASADAHAARGAWDAAVQDRLRAIVRALEERAILDERPGRTADEAAAEAGTRLPTLSSPLVTAALMFDDVRYGGRPGTEDMDHALRDLDRRCATTRPAHEPAAPVADRTPR
ncbi:DUF4129 domain-containing protein [Yinghuangia sp. YIM S10712]|uniref:DUF4129 domain-containing protein n=1 Tax=Yinghuangia sp. YIM S10712 TaxID=3436930 RepID=UPI003F53AA81